MIPGFLFYSLINSVKPAVCQGQGQNVELTILRPIVIAHVQTDCIIVVPKESGRRVD